MYCTCFKTLIFHGYVEEAQGTCLKNKIPTSKKWKTTPSIIIPCTSPTNPKNLQPAHGNVSKINSPDMGYFHLAPRKKLSLQIAARLLGKALDDLDVSSPHQKIHRKSPKGIPLLDSENHPQDMKASRIPQLISSTNGSSFAARTSNPRQVVGQAVSACALGEEQWNAAWATPGTPGMTGMQVILEILEN